MRPNKANAADLIPRRLICIDSAEPLAQLCPLGGRQTNLEWPTGVYMDSRMSFQTDFNTNNANVFLREFTYDDSRFRSEHGQEFELCDGAIWIDDLLILYQLKERNPDHDTGNPEKESKWFTNKVSKTAVNQLVDSITYLDAQKSLPLANLRGQTVNLSDAEPETIHKIVIYSSSESLPIGKIFLKGRVSKRIGFVHFFHVNDYRDEINS